jgi:hypothetical protein
MSSISVPPAEKNVTKLYQRLVAAGFLPARKADADREEEEEEEEVEEEEEEGNSIKPVDFSQPETLKV